MGPAYFYLQQARSIMPDMPDTYLQLGLVCMKTMRQDEALSYFKTAESIRPADSKIHFALGAVWSNRKNCTQARAEFSEALALDPKLTKAREQMDKCTVTVAGEEITRPGGIDDAKGKYAAPMFRSPSQPLLPVKE
jgi:tetratricopeptide (TPR) repeat protein